MRLLINTFLFFFLATAAWAASPAIFYSDLTAGPNTGGENNNGVYVTIWGNNFGSAQGSSYVTVGSGKVSGYPTWTNTMVTFQLGPNTSTGNIVLVTSGGTATGPSFTVQAGNIYFVQPGASSNGSGTFASPFNHLASFASIANPGDTVYVRAGTIYDEVDGYPGWHGTIVPDRGGTQGSPVSWIAYPNETVTLQADGGTQTWPSGSDNVSYIFRGRTDWHTFSKFNLVLSGSGGLSVIDTNSSNGWRIVGNNITAPTYLYAIVGIEGDNNSLLGNEIHDSGNGTYTNENHSIYWSGGGNNVEIGWNYLHDNKNTGWEISCFHQGTRVGKIHDNTITNVNGNLLKGILLGDVDSGEDQTTVEGQNIQVYNNVLYNLGFDSNGGSIQAVSGTAYIYNNTIYKSPESKGTIQFPSGGIGPGGGQPVWYVANNIIYNSLSNALYVSDGNGSAPNWSNFALMTNNNYYGAGNGPSQDPKPVNADPQFVANGTNFQLQASSPDINAGYNTLSMVVKDLFGFLRSTSPSIGAYEFTGGSNSVLPSLPVVSISSPANGAVYTQGSTLNITANASETNGSIAQVAFYTNGTNLLATDTSAPYTYSGTNATSGTYTITAVATDTNGVSTTSSPITITVNSGSLIPSLPAVSITSPVNGATYTQGSMLTVTAAASETNGAITKVDFYAGGTYVLAEDTTPPYNYTGLNATTGTFVITAVATDTNGVTTTSSPITITVNPASSQPSQPSQTSVPAVAITSPANGSTYIQNSMLSVNASASETNGAITKVDFYAGGKYLLAEDTTPPYNYTGPNATTGTYVITAVATDANGVTTTSSPITITVNPSSSQPSAPAVAITSPANGSTYIQGSTLSVTASASESNGTITHVSFYANGSYLLASDSTAPYNYTGPNATTGTYVITAVATDANGVTTTSSPITITVNPSTGPSLPSVSIISPSNNSTFTAGATLTITASASESGGSIKNVVFYSGSTLLGIDTTSAYAYVWTNVPAGSYALTAVATDANGANATSSPVTITVTPSAPAAPALTVQPTSVTVSSGATATFSVLATGNPAPAYQWMQSVNGGAFTNIDGATSSSYTTPPTTAFNNGNKYECIVSNASGIVTSNVVTLTVYASPVVTITSPANNSTLTPGSTINITATASETNGTITTVFFYNGSILLGSDSTPPYSYTLSNVPSGTYTLTVLATDARNNSQSSSPVTVIVAPPSLAPTITTQPLDLTVTSGSTASFTVAATGIPAPTYQWYQKPLGSLFFSPISGATDATYSFVSDLINTSSQYECIVSNSLGNVISNTVVLTVNPRLLSLL